ncbi:PH domain-containing protein [Thermomonospora amylolytica]|uniref:PH domain-containing protein n=1 Tax=Thermomonospora amylolytica TaxID=1411117 RepID=UPI000E6C1DBA|nr:PH domain-containing protein [Thermomonospora amylolytica]
MASPDKLLEEARGHLEPGEQVETFVAGTYEAKMMGSKISRAGVFVATDRRLLFYAKKIGGFELESFPYENISSFEQGKGMMGHSFSFFASGNKVSMKWISSTNFADFARLVTNRAGRKPPTQSAPPPPPPTAAQAPAPAASQEDVFAALEKLGKLRDAGVVTAEEFEAKKKELLDRI